MRHTVLIAVALSIVVPAYAQQSETDYLSVVRAYADAMLEHARDNYGEVHSPLFAAALDRQGLCLLEGDGLQEVLNIERADWGIRPHDRTLSGANPMHDQNLYQVLFALTSITDEKRYADAANDALAWFLQHCQGQETGLLAWGEHIGWDFRTETLIDKQARVTHEFFRPWVLWERCYDLAPKESQAFALGLWNHQIGDQATGNFSRHANYERHGPGANSEYPRHGGFYIATWAHAYKHSQDPVFLKAIRTLVHYFESRRHPESHAIPSESAERSKGTIVWPPSNLSLAIDLQNAAGLLPNDDAEELRQCARDIDKVFLALPHELSPGRRGFVTRTDTKTLGRGDGENEPQIAFTRLWATGYGDYTDAQIANMCALRYDQVKSDRYRKLIVDTANRYLGAELSLEFPVYPGTFGDVIWLMLNAHQITGDEKYLGDAHRFAESAIPLFLDDAPIPKAATNASHYEAITRADTLMMALLRLWVVENHAAADLVYSDR